AKSSIIAASHTADLAGHFGRQVRDLIAEHEPTLGYGLAPLSRSAARWRTSAGGDYFATGIRGPITGRRADLAIIDDPVKSFIEADRPANRDHLWNWYRSELVTRLKPRARIVLVMTRWHEDDLAGRLLESAPGEWALLRLAALAEEDDPLGRAPGGALWPDWEDQAALQRKRLIVGERVWAALYQQSPRPVHGRLFKPARIAVLDQPDGLSGKAIRAWDLAATVASGANDPDWTVGVKLLRETSGRFVIMDLVRLRGDPLEVECAITRAAALDGRAVRISLPEDPGQAGKAQSKYLIQKLAGHNVRATRETGSKMVRAMPLAAQMEAGNLAMVRANWNYALLEELGEFPYGRKDDQVDALARALNTLAEDPSPVRRVNASVLTR
ncbi:MAG: phage terminase large subunit, partial [Trebonia sp.]